MVKLIRPALALTLFFVLLTGLAFPFVVTGVAQAAFPFQANGSLIRNSQGTVVGSELIGQPFASPRYFHPRPSAAGSGYDATNSSGTNLGPTNEKLLNGLDDGSFAGVRQLAETYRKANGLAPDAILPADAVTHSASGLDPHISLRNAELQTPRVAKARGMAVSEVADLVERATEPAFLGIFGEPAVNVLRLNLSLPRGRVAEGAGRPSRSRREL
ncbi:MAG: K(+)-transporting ATPase subunit C [Fimbriimonas sp.]